MFIGRTDAEAETLILWPSDAKSWLIGKDSDAGRDCGQEEKGMTEDEMAGWHHQLDRHEFEWTPGVGDGQGGLACCDSWGCKESDMTERLNWIENSNNMQNSVLRTWKKQFYLTLPSHDISPWRIQMPGFIGHLLHLELHVSFNSVCKCLNCLRIAFKSQSVSLIICMYFINY